MQDEQELIEPGAEIEAEEVSSADPASANDGNDDAAGLNTDDAESKPAEAAKPKKRDRSYAARIGQLTAEKRTAERELHAMREQLTQQQQAPAQTAGPSRDDFDDYEDYQRAQTEHIATNIADQRIAEITQQSDERQRNQVEEQNVAAYNTARENLLGNGVESFSDFEEVAMSENLTISPSMADAVLVSDRGHEVMYHLGKNPRVAERISVMTPVQQLLELGRLEASLSPSRKASGAPAPTNPVTQRGNTSGAVRDNLSTDEWMKRRSAEIRKQS